MKAKQARKITRKASAKDSKAFKRAYRKIIKFIDKSARGGWDGIKMDLDEFREAPEVLDLVCERLCKRGFWARRLEGPEIDWVTVEWSTEKPWWI